MAKLSLTYREQLPPIVADELDQLLMRLNAVLNTSAEDVESDVSSLSSQVASLSAQVAAMTAGVELLVHKGAPSGYAGLTTQAVVGVSTGGTGTGEVLTPGSIVFATAVGAYAQDNANLFWDETTAFLGIGTVSPDAQLHTTGTVRHALFGVGVATFDADGDIASTSPLPVTLGGTGLATLATGDLLYGSAADTLSRLADVAAGSFLRSGGVSTAPVWSTTTWPNAATQGDVLYANAANAVVVLAKNTNATRYLSNTGTSNNPAWAQVDLTTGVTDVLPIANGGTNAATQTSDGVMYFDGTDITSGSAFTFDGAVVTAPALTMTGVVTLQGYTVATLPAGAQGDVAYVTDALAPAFLVAVVGGGAVVTPVFYNGAAWVAA